MKIAKKRLYANLFLPIMFLQLLLGALSLSPAKADESLFDEQFAINEVGQVYGGEGAKLDVRILVARIINQVLGFLAIIFFALTLFAGFQYMTAGGSEEKTQKALSLLKNAIIGLIIVLVSWALTKFAVIMLSRAINNSVNYTQYYNGL